MKQILLVLVMAFSVSCTGQQKKVTAVKDASGNLVGIANKESFLDDSFASWFTPNYDYYNPDAVILESLKTELKNVTIKAFMGTWCGDSQEQTPVFYKILDLVDFNYNNLELITVNRSKVTPDNLQEGFNIERVPTFIFYKDDLEIGRIVEYPIESIEADMLKIVTGKPYKHAYED